jgi:hypothetical protein
MFHFEDAMESKINKVPPFVYFVVTGDFDNRYDTRHDMLKA